MLRRTGHLVFLFIDHNFPAHRVLIPKKRKAQRVIQHGRMMAVVLGDQGRGHIFRDRYSTAALRIDYRDSPACFSSASFSTVGSSLPRAKALWRIP